jgi:hypothetical protein
MSLNEDQRRFVADVVEACASARVTLTLSPTEKVTQPGESEELGCSGFFIGKDRQLTVAMRKPAHEWLPVLLHEFGHMQQWLERPSEFCWDDLLLELFWEWLDGRRELLPEHAEKLADMALWYELDCEEQTAKRILESPGLELDHSDYVRRANSYLYLYPLIAKHRKWASRCPPYKVPEIQELMNDKFAPREKYWLVPPKVEELFIKKCFPEEIS